MPSKKRLRWQDTDYTGSPLLEYVIGCHSVQTAGLIPEIFAHKQAKRAAETYAWNRRSLTQHWKFPEQRELTIVGRFGEHPANLFRLHLRLRRKRQNSGNEA